MLDRFGLNPFTFAVARFTQAHIRERLGDITAAKARGQDLNATSAIGRGDLLSMLLKAKEEQPELFTDKCELVMAVSMAFAGSETTVLSVSAVFYYLIQTSQCQTCIRKNVSLLELYKLVPSFL